MTELVKETKVFNISTRSSACNILNTIPDYKSKCEFYIPDMIVRDESIEYIEFSIPYAVIPVSYYIINETNNILFIKIGTVTSKYTFPVANYTANLFMSQFLTTLGQNWSITLDSATSKFTISYIQAFQLLDTSTIDFVIGFSDTLNSSLLNGLYTAVMKRPCNFLPLPRICLRSMELSSGSLDDCIISIPNNSKLNGEIVYQNTNGLKALFRQASLNRFVLSITDDDGNYINFNGISSFFTFQFDIFRRFVPKLPTFHKIVEKQINREKIYFEEENLIDGDT